VDMSHAARLARYSEVSSSLALLSDRTLGRLVDDAGSTGYGIGGASAVAEVAGVPVFVKRVPLTDLERRPGSVMSTANLFGLPVFCQYGVGGPGFGAWRELAANAVTTGWVLARRTEAFPLMYHWRVLPGAAALAEELADVEGAVAYWGGSPAVRERISALAGASASVVLFCEYIPQVLRTWLGGQLGRGPEAMAAACTMLERDLRAGLAFMNGNGLLHFDAHFGNILTDGQRLYFADLGLATSPRFDLSAAESDFAGRHLSHDVCYALTQLVNWLVSNVCGVAVPSGGGPVERNDFIRRCAAGAQVAEAAACVAEAPAAVAEVIRRYAPVAVVMNDFYWDLFGSSRATPYPAVDIERAMAAIPAAFRSRGGLGSRDARLEPQRCAVLSHPLPRQERFGRGPRRAG
jgi:hypothetical protein